MTLVEIGGFVGLAYLIGCITSPAWILPYILKELERQNKWLIDDTDPDWVDPTNVLLAEILEEIKTKKENTNDADKQPQTATNG